MANESENREHAGTAEAPADEVRRLAGYEILEEIGRGTMGVVYRARQQVLQRTVALKVMLAGDDAHPEFRSRLCAGVEAAARLTHPNIVQIYEFGDDKGTLYVSMELVEGIGLNRFRSGKPWPTKAAAELIETLARAIHFAHERGIVHGDLKPTNVLLEGIEGREVSVDDAKDSAESNAPASELAAPLCPKITDLGLAKQIAGGASATDMLARSHGYMAPEQLLAHSSEVGPATDVYSLGAILFELLTGRPPFQGTSSEETVEQICRVEPISPTRLRPTLPPEISTICLTCLKKSPGKRYATAEDLADDLERFLTGKTIVARSITSWERAKKWMRDRPSLAALIGASIIAALAMFTVIVIDNGRLSNERNESIRLKQSADQQRERDKTRIAILQQSLYDAKMRVAWRSWDIGLMRRVFAELDETTPRGQDEDFRGFEWLCLSRLSHASAQALTGHSARVEALEFSPSGNLLASASVDGTIRLWNVPEGKKAITLRDGDAAARSLAFSVNGNWLAAGHDDGGVRVWDMGTTPPSLLHTKKVHSSTSGTTFAPAVHVAFSPDGSTLASAGNDGRLRIYVPGTMHETKSIEWTSDPHGHVDGLCFSLDGTLVAISESGAGDSSRIRLWNVATGQPARTIEIATPGPLIIGFPPGGNSIAGVGQKGGIGFWNFETGELQRRIPSPENIKDIAFDSRNGSWVAVGYGQSHLYGATAVIDAQSGEYLDVSRAHTDAVLAVAISPDGNSLASGSADTTVRLNDIPKQRTWWLALHEAIWSLELAPDNNTLAIGSNSRIRVVDMKTGELRQETTLKNPVTSLRFMPTGKSLVMLEQRVDPNHPFPLGRPKLWNLETGEQREWSSSGAAQDGKSEEQNPLGIAAFAITGDGDRFLTGVNGVGPDGRAKARLWEFSGSKRALEKTLPETVVTAVGLSADGSRAAIGCAGVGDGSGVGVVWNIEAGTEEVVLRNISLLHCLAFSIPTNSKKGQANAKDKGADDARGVGGMKLATGWGDNAIRIWNASDWRQLATMDGHMDTPTCFAFSPDGTRLASGSLDRTVKLWDLVTFQEVATLQHEFPVRAVRFTNDGNILIVGCADRDGKGELRFWHGGR